MSLPLPRLLNLMYHRWVTGLTPESRAVVDEALRDHGPVPVTRGRRRHVPGTAPGNIPAPSWWRGDRAAYNSTLAAGQQLGEPAAVRERPRAPMIGTRMAGVT